MTAAHYVSTVSTDYGLRTTEYEDLCRAQGVYYRVDLLNEPLLAADLGIWSGWSMDNEHWFGTYGFYSIQPTEYLSAVYGRLIREVRPVNDYQPPNSLSHSWNSTTILRTNNYAAQDAAIVFCPWPTPYGHPNSLIALIFLRPTLLRLACTANTAPMHTIWFPTASLHMGMLCH